MQESTAENSLPESSGSGQNNSAETEPPEEDPWAEGYFYDEALTAGLWALFATENTNNTGAGSPDRSMTKDFLALLDGIAEKWLYEGTPDSEAEQEMKALSFRFPTDLPETQRGIKSVKAAVYGLSGNDPEQLKARILLGNSEACFYLYLRAYYSPELDRCRVYMVNGLVW